MDLTLVIPAFNEAERIEATLRDVAAYLDGLGADYELLVVDDGSTDGTVALIESLQAEFPPLRCLVSATNRGKGHAVRQGMLAAQGRVRLMLDADGAMPPTELFKLIDPLRRGDADVAIGSRYVMGSSVERAQPGWRRAWSRVIHRVAERRLIPGIQDAHCGYKAFTAPAAERVFSRAEINGWTFDLEVLALSLAMGLGVEEVGIRWADDARTKVRGVRELKGLAREWRTIRRNVDQGVYRAGR